MKKRIFATLLALVMALGLLPTVAAAEGETEINDTYSWTPLSDVYKLDAGNYKLTSDVTVDKTICVAGTVTLDLNGHVLKMTGSGSVFQVGYSESFTISYSGHLTLKDSNPTVEHRFTPNTDGLWVLDETNGTKTVTGGIITGGSGCRGVHVTVNSSLTMEDGNIIGCTAAMNGGGVHISSGYSTFTMKGGLIAGCTAVAGGGVTLSGFKNTFTMSGNATIKSCSADLGGGVYIENPSSSFTMKGGSIQDCTATSNGGALSANVKKKLQY